MKLHEATLAIPAKEVIEYDTLMSQSVVDLDMECLPHMGNIKTWSVEFDNGNVFDLRVNTSDDDVWCEGLFLENSGNCYNEMYVDDVRDQLLGTYWFTDDDNGEKYVVYVVMVETLKGNPPDNKNDERKTKMKTYSVKIVETRAITILVEAESEAEADDKANLLHETSDEICEMLNDPCTNIESTINVIEEVEPKKGEKVF